MEVFCLDVAQGTCQIILLGDRRAIVIDCGSRSDRQALQFLARMGIDSIERLIVSHSHDDHIGGAVGVLGAFQDQIERICFVQDDRFLNSTFWLRISELYRTGRLRKNQLVRLEVSDSPQLVWTDDQRSVRLRTYSPTAAENLLAQQTQQPNPTSAVLFLEAGSHRIVFAADSEVAQWREIYQRAGRRLSCDVLVVPHHAGRFHSSADDLEWMYSQALELGVAVISVGTTNQHGHPRADVVAAIARHGGRVMCTQITPRCNGNDTNLEFLRPAVLSPVLHPGSSSPEPDFTDAGRSRNVACAGTVRVEMTAKNLTVSRLDDHQRAIDRLVADNRLCPLCRPAVG